MSNDELLAAAKKAVMELFSDTSVDPETARENLEEVASDIEGYLDTLPEGDDDESDVIHH